jgi:hypothetical protein
MFNRLLKNVPEPGHSERSEESRSEKKSLRDSSSPSSPRNGTLDELFSNLSALDFP